MPRFAALLLVSVAACATESADDASAPSTSPAAQVSPECRDEPLPSTCTLANYISANVCTTGTQEGCLEPLIVGTCANGGCPRYAWAWRAELPGRFEPHMTNGYLRLLREAAFAEPTASTGSWTWGLNNRDMLWHQTQAMLQSPYARHYDGLTRKTLAEIRDASRTVDPTRFTAVAWVNSAGVASAMAQADMATWFQSIGVAWGERGDAANATYYLRLSERAFRTFAMRLADGGVRNNKTGYKCHIDTSGWPPKSFYCYWFHSFAAGETDEVQSVLNQNLHAIRDAMTSYDQLLAWKTEGLERLDHTRQPWPSGLDPSHLAYLHDWARGGLLQLAFGQGARVDPSAPPNLYEFQYPAPWTTPNVGRFAAYRFADGKPALIKPGNTCHYHYHSMSLLKTIFEIIDTSPTFSTDKQFVDARYQLLYGRTDHTTCRQAPSPSVAGVPLATMYRAGHTLTTELIRYCDGIRDNDPEHDPGDPREKEYDDATSWLEFDEPRLYFYAAYDGCTF